MKIFVCTSCGSADIQQDAFIHYNDRENITSFDNLYCENCEGSCSVNEVEVPEDFDVYSDIYEEPNGNTSI